MPVAWSVARGLATFSFRLARGITASWQQASYRSTVLCVKAALKIPTLTDAMEKPKVAGGGLWGETKREGRTEPVKQRLLQEMVSLKSVLS